MKSSTFSSKSTDNDLQKDEFFKKIQPQLENLNKFIRGELEYHLATGDLKSDELTPEDVIDAVVLNAFEEYKKDAPKLPMDRWLVVLTMKHVRNEIRRLRKDREEFVHFEENIPETPPEEKVVTLGEETLDFYQPDEDLKMEDIIADPTATTPDQLIESVELLQKIINESQLQLPQVSRDVFVLYRVQGFSIDEVAEITMQSEKEVKQSLQQADRYLKKKLIDSRTNTPK